MKINQILESFQENEVTDMLASKFEEKFKTKRLLGGGGYAKVYSDDTHGEAIKHSRRNFKNLREVNQDAFLRYADIVKEVQELDFNPYLPRIYDLNVYRLFDQERNPVGYNFIVDMEQLTPFTEHFGQSITDTDHDSSTIYYTLMDKMFYKPQELLKHVMGEYGETYGSNSSVPTTEFIAFTFEEILSTPALAKYVKDKKLTKALEIVEITRQLGFNYDFADDNIMLRVGRGGPQIVFTDPLS